jgi:diguanylate cyclase (GGDEF)-like protein/PAS domain S-box-containing protein
MSSINEPEVWRGILESLPIGVCVLDLQKKIILWSDGAERITGHLRHEVIGRSCVSDPILHCDQPGCEFCSDECLLAQAMKTAHRVESMGMLHHKAGYEIPIRARAVPVHNEHGSIIGAVETFEENKEVNHPEARELISRSEVDPVTSAVRRETIESYLARALTRFREGQVPFGVLLLKIEQLAHFRSRFGAEAASSLLRLVARTLEGALWSAEAIGRWAEDQFLVLLPGFEEEAIRSTRERVRRTIAGQSIEWWGERHALPVSIGEATIRTGDSMEMLLDRVQVSLNTASAWLAGRPSADLDSDQLDPSGSQ